MNHHLTQPEEIDLHLLIPQGIEGMTDESSNGHCAETTFNDETRYARFPLPNPLPEVEGTNVSLCEFYVNEAIHDCDGTLSVTETPSRVSDSNSTHQGEIS
jgi:hypothetical protein